MKTKRVKTKRLTKAQIRRAQEIACRVADDARKRLRRSRGWTQQKFHSVDPVSRGNGRTEWVDSYCLVGAIREAERREYFDAFAKGEGELWDRVAADRARLLVRHALANAIRTEIGEKPTARPDLSKDENTIIVYNDAEERKKKDVLARIEDLRGEVCE